MRQTLFLFALGCSVLSSGIAEEYQYNQENHQGYPITFNGTNYFNYTSSTSSTDSSYNYNLIRGVECNNTINGVVTSATDIGDGTIRVRGCGNSVSNVTTAGGAPANVTVSGFDNVVSGIVVSAAVMSTDGFQTPSVVLGGGDSIANGNTLVNNVVSSIVINDASDNVVTGNTAGGKLEVRNSIKNAFVNNEVGGQMVLDSDFHGDVESNDADYNLRVKYANYVFHPGNNNAPAQATENMAVDVAPVFGTCGGPFNSTTNDGAGVECAVMLPPGELLSAGTGHIPGTSCTGGTTVQLLNSSDLDVILSVDPNMERRRRSLLTGDMYCAFAEYFNDGEASLNITIRSACAPGQNNDPVDCTGTSMYSITGVKTTVIKRNKADSIVAVGVTSDVIESNSADYSIRLGDYSAENNQNGVRGAVITNNTAGYIGLRREQNDAYHVDVIDKNHVEYYMVADHSNNLTISNNTVSQIQFHTSEGDDAGSNQVYTGLHETASKPIIVENSKVRDKNLGLGSNHPLFAEAIRFSGIGAGAIAGITDDVTAVAAPNLKTTAVSAAAMQALVTSQAATNAALQALVANLTAQVNTLKSGFCPPAAAGRHLLSTLTPIVPPAGCGTPAGGVPAAVTAPTDIVTTTLSLSGVDLTSFSTASVAAALAATAGINVADVDVVVTDFPVSTTVSFTGVALTSLTAAQVTGITNAIDAKLPAAAMVPALGTVTPAGRRLLDLSFPVTVTSVGASTTAATQTQAAVTSAATLAAAALAVGLQSSAASATPATVSAVMTVTVRAASASSAASIAAALSPANTAAISAQLAANGVTNTGVTITQPVLSKPAAPQASSASISGQDKKDLLALLVLLIIPVANAAYFGGKYLERRRAEHAARAQVFGVEHAASEGKQQAVDVVVVDSA